MVTIKKFPKEYCTLYDPSNKKIGRIYSEIQMYDIFVQIKKEHLEGYYIILKGIRFDISERGWIPLRGHLNRDLLEQSFLNISDRLMKQLMGF